MNPYLKIRKEPKGRNESSEGNLENCKMNNCEQEPIFNYLMNANISTNEDCKDGYYVAEYKETIKKLKITS